MSFRVRNITTASVGCSLKVSFENMHWYLVEYAKSLLTIRLNRHWLMRPMTGLKSQYFIKTSLPLFLVRYWHSGLVQVQIPFPVCCDGHQSIRASASCWIWAQTANWKIIMQEYFSKVEAASRRWQHRPIFNQIPAAICLRSRKSFMDSVDPSHHFLRAQGEPMWKERLPSLSPEGPETSVALNPKD